jgi:hypothetical protein
MGVLSPGSAHVRPSAQPPIEVSRKFSGTRVSRFTFWNFPHFPVKIGLFWGVGGVLIFMLLRSPCKIWEPYDNSFLEIKQMTGRERTEERERRGERE